MARLNIVGERFTRLTVIKFEEIRGRYSYWLCRCDCGNETIVRGNLLTYGSIKSCGCLHIEAAQKQGKRKRKHGKTKTAEYNAWCGAKARCYNPNDKAYLNYGGRGIKMCKRWRDSFDDFLEDMGKRPSQKHTIERINNDGDYSPENCRWATRKEQAVNKRNNCFVAFNGETNTISQWSRKFEVTYRVLQKRINQLGWPIEKALTEPIKEKRKSCWITFQGKTMRLVDWAKLLNIKHGTLHNRIYLLKWPVEKALKR